MTTPELILKTAADLISGPRAQAHGDYRKLHQRVAELWSAFLKRKVTPEQVALCLALVKVARDEVGNYNIDDGIDATAYTALWAALSNGSRPQDQEPERNDAASNMNPTRNQYFTTLCNWETEE